MEAWEFCRIWFNKDSDDEDLSTRAYKSSCNQLLQERLGVGPRALQKWGHRYQDMPLHYKQRLGETFIFISMLDELNRMNPGLCQGLIARLQQTDEI